MQWNECSVVYSGALFIAVECIEVDCIAMECTAMECIVLCCDILRWDVLQCMVHCSGMYCSELHCIAVYSSLQWNVLDDLRDKPPLSCCPFASPIIFSNLDHD